MIPSSESTDPLPISSQSVDNTVNYVIAGTGIILAFAVILSTFAQVDHAADRRTRVTSPPAPSPVQSPQIEIGVPSEK